MATTSSSPFTRAVVKAMRRLYPEDLADKSFDNTGLLLEAPFNPSRQPQKNSVLLTNDLTTAVAEEAIQRRDSVVVAYHPIIFRGLKSLTLADTQQTSLLRLAAEGISVYCPHTAIDAQTGGNGDWLADILTGTVVDSTASTSEDKAPTVPKDIPLSPAYALHQFPSSHDARPELVKLAHHPHTRVPIHPNAKSQSTGTGRLLTLDNPLPLGTILHTLTTYLGHPPSYSIATPLPPFPPAAETTIRTIALCAGSGGSVLLPLVGQGKADLLVTGEMSHHEALAAVERGVWVVCLGHSNSERAFLGAVLKPGLEGAVRDVLEEEGGGQGEVQVEVSRMDRDPFGYAVLET